MGNCRNKSESWLSTAWDLPNWIQETGWPYSTRSPMGSEAGAICCLLLLCPTCLPKNNPRFLEDKALQAPLIFLVLGVGFFFLLTLLFSEVSAVSLDLKVMKEWKQTPGSTSSHSETPVWVHAVIQAPQTLLFQAQYPAHTHTHLQLPCLGLMVIQLEPNMG